ncbi:cysteine--tRNA ligase [Salipiger marinus]|uniref:cysteine--tRNA ligase n=1 Tax=Salipiger marinus TaxID=555512 RepID=UPI001E5E524E|nr:cysteine--tRNA ligase [Salipiger manganoxidans]MCD1619236.1 cysteine--tRNA ligase [Salipiger manganoxidans]MEB3419351.1 cysteine--tRNA ligase [Salipiger manganoxidans]
MDIFLTNSRSRTKERFTPLDPANVRVYVCGPTVYDRAHLGNARPAIVFDVLSRLLRHVYGAEHVTYVRNFTDVDDKINARAAETGRDIAEITEETIGWYLDDMAAVGVAEPDHMPRATRYIAQMVVMIADLIAKGHAYEAEGHVLFAVESYADYGALSGRSLEDMIAGARVEVAPYKRNPMDFVLWKPSAAGLPGWDSPWGRGRPGWHIECSAMAQDLLGASFDIHGGGNDLMFPHHENEIAQSCCAHPEGSFAKVWLHNEMLQVEGRKMSKSLGNFFTVRDLLDQGIPGEVIRFVMLSTHYRKPMDWTAEKAEVAEKKLRRWRRLAKGVNPGAALHDVLAPLADDLNTSLVLDRLDSLARAIEMNQTDPTKARFAPSIEDFVATANLLGLLLPGTHDWSMQGFDLSGLAARLAEIRATAMETKDFSEVDRLKAALVAAGVEVRMSKAGVELVPGAGFDASALEGLE